MKQYLDFVRYILENGERKDDRTGVGTISTFGYQMRFDLNKCFPLLTTKKVFLRGIIHELLWFIRGETNIRPLVLENVKIWNDWPYKKYKESSSYKGETMEEFIEKIKDDEDFAKVWGELGPVYGHEWRHFDGQDCFIDQLAWVINEIKTNPNSRRLIVNSWQAAYVDKMALPPCHMAFQFYVRNGKLSCQLYQRSADAFLGVPFNIASYALLTMMIAKICNLEVGEFIHTFGDCHIYTNHIDQINLQLSREPKELPQMIIHGNQKNIEDFKYEDFELVGYDPYPAIKGEVAV